MIKFVKFFFSWIFTYLINIWFTYVLINYCFLSKDVSYLIAILIVTIVNFMISLTFTFKNTYSHKLFFKYITILILFSFLNYILVYYIKSVFPLNYYILIFIITTLIFFFKFITYDKYVFWKWKINN